MGIVECSIDAKTILHLAALQFLKTVRMFINGCKMPCNLWMWNLSYEIYLTLIEDVCSKIVLEDELSHLLDYLLDFACDEKILGLYKRVCRRYLYIYPSCVKLYIEVYREMWEDVDEDTKKKFSA